VRLDRGLADNDWIDLFGNSTITHVQTTESDHCALIVNIVKSGVRQGSGRGKPFRYENMWQRRHLYHDTVAAAWNGGCSNLDEVAGNLGSLQSTLTRWGREEFGSVKNELQKLRQQLEAVRSRTIHNGPAHEERRLMAKLSEMLAREEAMEKQWSRVLWVHEGDRNTGFFQAKARNRARTNRITAIQRQDGTICENQEELEAMAAAFYQNLFLAQENTDPALVTRAVPRKVTDEMNSTLTTAYSQEEVKKALFMMHPDKSPGPDGFTAAFYQ